jgi:hypothetical protein
MLKIHGDGGAPSSRPTKPAAAATADKEEKWAWARPSPGRCTCKRFTAEAAACRSAGQQNLRRRRRETSQRISIANIKKNLLRCRSVVDIFRPHFYVNLCELRVCLHFSMVVIGHDDIWVIDCGAV